ncbi:MAG: hypothetical protein ACI9MC_002570 [Kiritimatiellia bacterium]|jgi:hypothetical protein
MIGLQRLLFWPVILGSALISGGGSALAYTSYGVESFEHPDGISLRQESAGPVPGAFFLFYSTHHRRHSGGGLHGGK